jgi:putative nucleotidyltransferase with HDIG domain
MVTLGGASTAKEFALREMASRINELPLLPQSFSRILKLDPNDQDYFSRLEQYTKAEPSFAVRIVAKANANAHRVSTAAPVLTLNGAMVRLGGTEIRTLVSSLAVQRVFVPTTPDQIRLWIHSVHVAVAAERIAEIVPELRIVPDTAYLAGLLHDIGRFVMFEHDALRLTRVNEKNWRSPEDLIRSDIDVFSFTHCELGYLACKRWHLPDGICQVVRYHHSPFQKKITPKSIEALVFCVQLADRLTVSVIEDEPSQTLSVGGLETRIREVCYQRPQDRSLLPANRIAHHVQPIKEHSENILAELGF